jgi:pimeloyl-ACP methyl ester carboxylesterase
VAPDHALAGAASHRHRAGPARRRGSVKPAAGYDKKTMAVDIHELASSLKLDRVNIVGHDIGLMVAYAYAAQFREDTERVVLMDAFLPGIGN